jgi:hemerythrin-like domain-containing protein
MATRKRTGSKKKSSKSAAPTDAIALLKKDHEKVRGLLSQLEKSAERGGDRAMRLYTQVEAEVKVHSQVEEEIFYPAFRDAAQKKDDTKMFYEATEEHHVVDLVMPELRDTDSKEEFAAKAKVLKELIEHHADEEEKEMFPRARKLMDRDELRELGERMERRKSELQ